MTMKKKLFDIIQIGDKSNFASRLFDFTLVAVIFINIGTMLLQTFSELTPIFPALKVIEIVTTIFFLIEYILRIYTADLLYPNKPYHKSVFRFIFSFDGLVDLLTIIPLFFLSGFVVFRILRVIRIFHLFRINTQSDSFNVITKVLYNKRNQILSSLVIIFILMVASSLCMYSVEHYAQPEVFKNAFSGLWWAVSAMLTVGYGDICPITTLGRIMAIFISFLGVGAVAIPTGIISAGFVEQYTKDSNTSLPIETDSIGEIHISVGHEYEGLSLLDLYENYHIRTYLIIRDNLTIIPTPDFILKSNDTLFIQNSCPRT